VGPCSEPVPGLNPHNLLGGPGLQTLLHSHDFSQWEAVVAGTLGHHRSTLLEGSPSFEAEIRGGSVEEFQVLHLRGNSKVQMLREQCGHGVLWLPLEGLTQEWINGNDYLAEPGMALLFRPGDAMQGLTSEQLTGVSILIPKHHLQGLEAQSPLVGSGLAHRKLIAAGLQLAQAAAWQPQGSRQAAAALADALQQWGQPLDPSLHRERVTAKRRRHAVAEACRWMEEHLAERFSIGELSQAMGLSIRTLQYCFQQELGCTPMAEAKQLRLRRLRRLLQNPNLGHRSIAELMAEAGLLACGVTSADYRRWCGETPRRTRTASTTQFPT